jgi:hypothetical protein
MLDSSIPRSLDKTSGRATDFLCYPRLVPFVMSSGIEPSLI